MKEYSKERLIKQEEESMDVCERKHKTKDRKMLKMNEKGNMLKIKGKQGKETKGDEEELLKKMYN